MRDARLHPALWDYQYYPLVRLRQAVEKAIPASSPAAGMRPIVIDFGCGGSPYSKLFRAQGYRYVGLDIDGKPDVRIAPDGLPIRDAAAEGVVSFQVLEHVWEVPHYLQECRRVCRPGGWLMLSTHGTWPYHPHPTDFRRWTRDGLVRELSEQGFDVIQVAALVGPLAWTSQIRLLGVRELLRRVPWLGPAAVRALFLLGNPWILLQDAITPAAIRDTNACIYLTFSKRRDDSGVAL